MISYANSDNHIYLITNMKKSTKKEFEDFDKFEFDESDDLYEFIED